MVGRQFNQQILQAGTAFFDRRMSVDSIQFVMAGWASWSALRGIRNLFVLSMRKPYYLAISAVPMVLLGFVSLIGNLIGRRIAPRPANDRLCSSVGVAMRVVSTSFDVSASKACDELELAGQRFEIRMPQVAKPSHRTESV
jgi:hypothetical protein